MWPLVCFSLVVAQSTAGGAGGDKLVTTTGYVDSRTTEAATVLDGAPALTELAEANVQVKVTPSPKFTVFGDASLYWQGAWFIHGGNRDVPQYRPTVVLSELYVDAPLQDGFRVVVGKKRIVWGAGLSFNPTDALNPPKDPTDPTFQRAGAWLGEVEWGFERVALSLVTAAKVTRQYAGLPTGLVTYPPNATYESTKGWAADDRDDLAHFAFAGRLYLLLADTDVNVSYSFSNVYNDAFANKSRVGLSLSHVFGALETHVEAVGYGGSARVEANPVCLSAAGLCVAKGVSLVTRPELDASWFNGRVLVGGRYQFDDNGFASLEYYYNGEGHSRSGFERLATLARVAPALLQQAIAGSGDPGTPQKFSFEPLRRHYLVATYSKPQIFDDFTVNASALVGLEDLSMQLVPQVQWAPKEWLQVTLAVYVPLGGVASWGVKIGDATFGEFTLSGFGTRVLGQARVFF